MGFFDRFKSKFEQSVRVRRPKSPSASRPETKAAKTEGESRVKETARPTESRRTPDAKPSPVAHRVLYRPLVTEKTATLAGTGKYAFVVPTTATKLDVKRAVREVYGVLPVSVNILRYKGKAVRFGRTLGKRKDWKKAIVTMPAGKTLPIYE